jgi:NADH dehydrogenase FAD-containing subunit
MPLKEWKDKNRCTITEWAVATVDEFGDIIDVNNYDTPAEAQAAFDREADAVAVVLEKRLTRYPMHRFREPRKFTVLATKGDAAALAEGGWVAGTN